MVSGANLDAWFFLISGAEIYTLLGAYFGSFYHL